MPDSANVKQLIPISKDDSRRKEPILLDDGKDDDACLGVGNLGQAATNAIATNPRLVPFTGATFSCSFGAHDLGISDVHYKTSEVSIDTPKKPIARPYNLVVTAEFPREVDLTEAVHILGFGLNRRRFPVAWGRLWYPRVTPLIYPKKIVVTGAERPEDAGIAISMITHILCPGGVPARNIRLHNIAGSIRMGNGIDLAAMQRKWGQATVAPKNFPGVQLYGTDPRQRSCVIVFGSGRTICTGYRLPCDWHDGALLAYEMLQDCLISADRSRAPPTGNRKTRGVSPLVLLAARDPENALKIAGEAARRYIRSPANKKVLDVPVLTNPAIVSWLASGAP